MNTRDYSLDSPFSYREGEYLSKLAKSNSLVNGESTMDRENITLSAYVTASQRVLLTHFTALETDTVTKVAVATGGTAAAATPTLCRIGVYSVADNGNLTLLASTPNDTTLFAAANTVYEKALSVSFLKEAGKRYAVGILVVSIATLPTFLGTQVSGLSIVTFREPKTASLVNTQADLPSSISNGSLTPSNGPVYSELLK